MSGRIININGDYFVSYNQLAVVQGNNQYITQKVPICKECLVFAQANEDRRINFAPSFNENGNQEAIIL